MDIIEIRMRRKLVEAKIAQVLEEFQSEIPLKVQDVHIDVTKLNLKTPPESMGNMVIVHVHLEAI